MTNTGKAQSRKKNTHMLSARTLPTSRDATPATAATASPTQLAYGTRDFAGAVQNTLVKSVEMGLFKMPHLVACFDEKAKTITVVEYETMNSYKHCALAPMGW